MRWSAAKREDIGEESYDSDNRTTGRFLDLIKAKKRHPAAPTGFTRIPKSKHGGYRKKIGDHYGYWYPDAHKAEDHLDWEADVSAGRGTATITPGTFVALTSGPKGIFVYTPDARKAPADPKLTWVTPVSPEHGHAHGTPIQVKRDHVQAQRSVNIARPPKKAKTRRAKTPKTPPKWQARHDPQKLARRGKNPADELETKSRKARAKAREVLISKIAEAQEVLDRAGRRRIRSPAKRAALQDAIVAARAELETVSDRVGGPGKLTDKPSANIQAAVYSDSTAKAGTILHNLENGAYALVQFHGKDEHFEHGRRTHGIFVPPQDVKAAFNEFADVFDNAASEVARTYRVGSAPELEDVRSGARLGFMLALRTYVGGQPFEIHARRYAAVYAQQAARDVRSGGAATIPKRQMQMIHGLIAAKSRAASKAGGEPTDEQIAASWYLSKKSTFTGRSANLGTYPHPTQADKRIEQSDEQVPLGPWQVLGPDGVPRGKEHPGKLALIREIDPILSGSRVEDSEWLNENEGSIVPTGADPTLPVGARYHMRQEIDQVLADLPNDQAELLTVLFGLDPVPFGGESLEAGDEKRRVNPDHAVTAVELSDRMGLAKPDSTIRDKQRKAKAAVETAIRTFKIKADALGYRHIADRASDWDRMISPDRPEPLKTPSGPSHNDLSERFGGDDKVAIYSAGIRAGNGEAVAAKLDKLKAGKLSAKQHDAMLTDYLTQRDAERLAEFRRQTRTVAVDPAIVRDASTGTPGDSDWLYTPEVLDGAMRALVSGRQSSTAGSGDTKQSKVWTDRRFQSFMGQGQQHERMSPQQGGDNG